MTNLTLRMEPEEKRRLMAWAALRGRTATEYIKGLVAADMAAGSPEERAAAWRAQNAARLADEAEALEKTGIPGADIALNHPWPDAEG